MQPMTSVSSAYSPYSKPDPNDVEEKEKEETTNTLTPQTQKDSSGVGESTTTTTIKTGGAVPVGDAQEDEDMVLAKVTTGENAAIIAQINALEKGKGGDKNDVLRWFYGSLEWFDSFTPEWMRRLKLNASVYNTFFVTEIIVESIPQMVINLANGYFLPGSFSVFSWMSLFFSAVMILYNVLKIVYYVGILNKDIKDFVL